jgi:hypothetical protein
MEPRDNHEGDVRVPLRPESDDGQSPNDPPDHDDVSDQLPVQERGDALRLELRAYLDTLTITGDTIGDIRRRCFVPWESEWNGIVRDETAKRERG